MSASGRARELLTLSEIARRLDVGARQVQNLAVEGMPRRKDRRGHWRYDWQACLGWYLARRESAAARRAEPASMEEARQRRETAQAGLAELDLAKREGSMVAVEDVEIHVADLLARLRAKVVVLPGKYAHRLAGATVAETQARLEEAVEEILGELAGTGEEAEGEVEPVGAADVAA